MRRVAITTLGCKINQFESAAMAEKLEATGFLIVPFSEQADIYLINTCTVTAKTDAESRQLIRRAARLNPAAKIVVTGCYAQVAKDELLEMPGIALILGNAEKKGIEELLKEIGGGQQVIVSDIFAENGAGYLSLESFAEHTRAFLQIQNGCNNYCAYCIVPYARGKSRSVPFDDVLDGIRAFSAKGYREVVLTGIHLGAYGLDLAQERSLLDLITAVEDQRLVQRLRLGSVEPMEISDAFIEFMSGSTITCQHLHIPLQSGSDGVLKRMNRKYGRAFFQDRIEKLMARSPDICIGADVIAGFPGETDQEFTDTYRLIEALPFAYLHVFPYSPRKGTPAATMTGKVAAKTIKDRAKALRDLSDRKKHSYYERFIGRELPVLFLNSANDGRINGLSRNYLQVKVPGTIDLVNLEELVRITKIERGTAFGEIEGQREVNESSNSEVLTISA